MDGSKLSIKSEAGLESTDSGIDSQPVFPSTFKVVLLFIIAPTCSAKLLSSVPKCKKV